MDKQMTMSAFTDELATVAEIIDSRGFSEFCGVDSSNQVPDGDTLLNMMFALANLILADRPCLAI